jgi:DNA polymerase-3 subunit alpha
VEPIYEASAKEQADQAKGVLSLFGKMDDFTQGRFLKEPAVKNKRPLLEKLLKEKELLGFFLTGHPLDNYRPILSRLSCIPLSQLDDLDHDAVFRAAFIVESIQVRLSSKTQKKFAILMINDGMESYELPIWSDLYEEKQMLLKENQLLYAVLQVDKREEIVKLSCRWLDDLTRADEAMIEDCDRAFDKAKSFVARQSKFSKGKEGQKEKMKPEKKVEEKEISLKFDADKGRLSHIIQIKEIFEQHRGPVPVYIEFISGEAKVATLQIDSRWGVTDTPQLYEALQKLACLILS